MQGGHDLPFPVSSQEVTLGKHKGFHMRLGRRVKIKNTGYIKPHINNFQPLMYYKKKMINVSKINHNYDMIIGLIL